MPDKIECLIAADCRDTIVEIAKELSDIAQPFGDTQLSNIEKSVGMFETQFVAEFLLTVGTSVATGIAANAIWEKLKQKQNAAPTTQSDTPFPPQNNLAAENEQPPSLQPENALPETLEQILVKHPVTIKAKHFNVVININGSDKSGTDKSSADKK